MNNIIIRKETKEDYKKTEYMVMRAFWNINGPGCNEHLLVRLLRKSKDFIENLSYVAELEGEIVGCIFYTKAKVVDGSQLHEVITFGPLAVEPTLFGRGIGRKLLEKSIKEAELAGYPGIVILGEPGYYPKIGFETTRKYKITSQWGYVDALMAYKLNDSFDQIHGVFAESPDFELADDVEEIAKITAEFPYHKPLKLSCQWLHEQRLGRICEIQKNIYYIQFFELKLSARLKGSFYNEGNEMPVVGDYVTFLHNPIGDSMITGVCERHSLLKRPDQSGHAIGYVKTMQEQGMVANFDYVFIVASLNDNYNINRITRYVSICLDGNGIPVVILTKSDICSNPGRYVREVEAISDKIRVHTISALHGIGLDELDEYLKPGNTIAILGSSGVGKSTLVNSIVGSEVMKTSQVREEDSKGRHTTTFREMITLENGAVLIDTPGMRELGMCDNDEGIEETFSDITDLEYMCKFSDCKHDTEPGCAVKKALEDGTLSAQRYDLFLKLRSESNHSAKMKSISKARKKYDQLKPKK